jgi:hypothetical protein
MGQMLAETLSLAPASERAERTPLEPKLLGLLFSLLIAATPILIVALSPPHSGGIFVAGYLAGAFTAPLVLLGILKAAHALFGSNWLNSVLGVLIYLTAIVLISVAAMLWSFALA